MRKIIFYRFESGECPVQDYLDSLSNKQVEKVFFVLDLIENFDIVPSKFFKKLESTDDIWEARIQYGSDIFRIFGFFDGQDLVVMNHAFTKKTQKIPPREIETAERRKKEYFIKRSLS